ncbi:MAG: acetate kinase [Vallitaleaceae bacterium]|nr:acetate kinase [Vallitaleaceae bacterium]
MKVLVINCGSSSLKYQLINMEDENVMAIGICERIGIEGSQIKHNFDNKKLVIQGEMADHNQAGQYVVDALISEDHGVIESMDEISAVGHRIVHGGEFFSESTLINDEVIQAVESCSDLAPLHNPANLIGIKACQIIMPNTPMVGVFDTAFHQTMPKRAYMYGIPYRYYRDYKVRRYGFHGTSHKYVARRTANFLEKDINDLKIVVCHLGNGASVCAVDGGFSVDTSMGLTPLEGLIMGTRSGDIDPAIVKFIAEKDGLDVEGVNDILNKESGILGLSEISSDFRDLENAIADGNSKAEMAMDVFHYRVAKYIGSYAAAMNGLDAVVFTAGLGENNKVVRASICSYLGYLGVKVDEELNNVRGINRDFSAEGATVRSLIIPTNEELMIARDTMKIVNA